MRQEVIDLVKQANEDLKTARILIKESRWYASVFFSQQVGEKYLKGLYLVRKRKAALTHNLNQIAHELNVPRNVVKAARELNPDYITTRLPGTLMRQTESLLSNTTKFRQKNISIMQGK